MTRWDYRINFQLEIVTGNPLYRAKQFVWSYCSLLAYCSTSFAASVLHKNLFSITLHCFVNRVGEIHSVPKCPTYFFQKCDATCQNQALLTKMGI